LKANLAIDFSPLKRYPDFRKYDSETNKFAVLEAKKRKTAPNN